MRLCGNCKAKPTISKHFNSKWCKPCGDSFRSKPRHNLTASQQRFVLKNRGKLSKEEMAQELGASRSSIMRFGRALGLSLSAKYPYKANPKLVQAVCDYYSKYGRRETEKRFPRIKIRSVVERYEHEKRQIRWTNTQLIELAQMAGVVSMKAQAKYFNRPRANQGSIISVWMKTIKNGGGSVNGLSWNMAKHFVRADCPKFQTNFWTTAKKTKGGTNHHSRVLVTWVDLNKNLKPDTPKWFRDCADSMSNFQIWLQGTERPRQKLIKLMKEREL